MGAELYVSHRRKAIQRMLLTIVQDFKESVLFLLVEARATEQAEDQNTPKAAIDTGLTEPIQGTSVYLYDAGTICPTAQPRYQIPKSMRGVYTSTDHRAIHRNGHDAGTRQDNSGHIQRVSL